MELLRMFLLIGHVIGVALGAGGATMSDVLFVTSISDNRIDKSELRLLDIASKVVVAGLILLTITGVGFLLTGTPTSPRFWAKMTIVLIASLNGFVMHKLMFPIFERCVKDRVEVDSAEFTQYSPMLLIAGPVSAVSWYAALILGTWRTLQLTYLQYMAIYGVILTGAIAAGTFTIHFALNNRERVQGWLGKWFSAEVTQPQLQPAFLIEVVNEQPLGQLD